MDEHCRSAASDERGEVMQLLLKNASRSCRNYGKQDVANAESEVSE